MKLTESRLRQIIRKVVKENYSTVPAKPGIYTSKKKHIAGNLWDLLGCKSDAEDWLNDNGINEGTHARDVLLNKIVFGNYGPEYDYEAGIYYGGYDWNNEKDDEDPTLESENVVAIVNAMMRDLGVQLAFDALKRRFEGKQMYEELANPNRVAFSSQGPGNPPKYAYNSQDPQDPVSVAFAQKSGRHVLTMYFMGGQKEQLDFKRDTGLSIKSPKYDGNTVVVFMFFEDNKCLGYYDEPYTDVSRIKLMTASFLDNGKVPSTTKHVSDDSVRRFIALNNGPEKDYIGYVSYGSYRNQAYYIKTKRL